MACDKLAEERILFVIIHNDSSRERHSSRPLCTTLNDPLLYSTLQTKNLKPSVLIEVTCDDIDELEEETFLYV